MGAIQTPARLTGLLALVLAITACTNAPTAMSSPALVGIEVLETRIEPPIGTHPVVGVLIRAPRLVGDYGFSWSARVEEATPSTSFGRECSPMELSGSVDLLTGDAGTIYPAFAAEGQAMDSAWLPREGWLTARLADSLMNVGLDGCELTFIFSAGWELIAGASLEPAKDAPPEPTVIASVRVRGDGTALSASPRPVITPRPTISPMALEAQALTSHLLPIISDWNDAAGPVVIGLSSTSDLVRWADDTWADRRELSRVLDRMSLVIGQMTQSEFVDPFGDIVVNYAKKLDGFNGIAAGAVANDRDRIRAGFAELELAVRQAPGVAQRWVSAISPYLTVERVVQLQGAVDGDG